MAKHLPIFVLSAVVACIASASAQTPRPQLPPLQLGSHLYEARTAAPARTQGNVAAGGITWACQNSVCSVRGPWPQPGVPACHALALQVGVIASYGRSGAMLTAAQLAECNAGVAAASVVTPGVRVVTPSLPIRRPGSRAPVNTPPDTPTITTDASGAIVVSMPDLSFVGGVMQDLSDRAAPAIAVDVGELSFVGGTAVDLSERAAPAIVVNTEELSFVGR